MPEIVQTDDACTLAVPPIRLNFRWDGARWAHQIEADERVVAASVEWDSALGDPTRVVSPVFQQLSVQDEGRFSRALLVGQWGPHHCSAVFTIGRNGDDVAIEADVAVRTRGELAALASTYSVDLSSSNLTEASPETIEWALGESPFGRLRFEPGDSLGMRVTLAEAGRRMTQVQADAPIQSKTSTHRLLYRWRWLPEPTNP